MKKNFRASIAAVAVGVAVLALPAAAQATPPKNCLNGCLLTTTIGTVNMRSGPSDTYSIVTTTTSGATVELGCYVSGESVNGDTTWYWSEYASKWGYFTGYYLNTGHDPSPYVDHC